MQVVGAADHSLLPHRRSASARAVLGLAVFAILYNISFAFNESVSTGRITMLVLLGYMLFTNEPVYRQRDWLLLLLFVPLPYVVVLFAFSHDAGQLSRFFHLALYSFLGANIVARLAGSLEDLLSIILGAISVQALLIFYSFVSLDYRAWFDVNVVSGSNIQALDLYRAPGLSSAGGSALSVVQALGVMAGGLLLFLQRERSVRRSPLWVLLQMLLCLLSCIFVGRTGLLLSLYFLVVLCVRARVVSTLATLCFAIAAPVVLLAAPFIDNIMPASFSSDYFWNWVFGFFLSGRDESVSELTAMPIPPLSLETTFGTGLISLVGGGNASGHDSGFVQAYFAMGVPVSVLFFAIYAFVLWRLFRWLPVGLRVLMAAPFLALEVKEPYLFKYAGMFVAIALYTLASQNRSVGSHSS